MKKELIILTLLLIIYLVTLNEPPLKDINKTVTGDYVRVRGLIKNCATPPRLTIFTLTNGTDNIKTVFFKQLQLNNNLRVEVTGRVSDYKGEKELKGVRIKLLN